MLLKESAKTGPGNRESGVKKADLASLYMAIAIGGQARGVAETDAAVHASRYFACARKMAFEDMLNDPCIGTVRLFILLSFYMIGCCSRKTAYVYLGIASKCALALGVFLDEGTHSEEDKTR